LPELRITRRGLLAALLTGAVAGVAGRYWLAEEAGDRPFDIDLPDVPGPDDDPSLEVFLALSKLICLRTSLDMPTAERMYALFMDEPWGPHHIRSSYRQILRLAGRPPYTTPPAGGEMLAGLGEGQAWFASHVLTTWYLGIYYHQERETRRVAYETALMYEAVRGLQPIPLVQATGFGAWTRLPDNGQ